MREILFRAWNKYHQKMYNVYQLDFDNSIAGCQSLDHNSTHTFGFIDLELLQFTGLTDRNGVNIFEGDILKDGIFNVYGKVYRSEFSASFECDELILARGGNFIVAGNIYQNDELLK